MFNKDLKFTYLFDFYGDILSEKRQRALELYYNEDYSLSEIAETMKISRQAARELIKKAEADLLFFESKLGLAERFGRTRDILSDIRSITQSDPGIPKDLKDRLALLEQMLSDNL